MAARHCRPTFLQGSLPGSGRAKLSHAGEAGDICIGVAMRSKNAACTVDCPARPVSARRRRPRWIRRFTVKEAYKRPTRSQLGHTSPLHCRSPYSPLIRFHFRNREAHFDKRGAGQILGWTRLIAEKATLRKKTIAKQKVSTILDVWILTSRLGHLARLPKARA